MCWNTCDAFAIVRYGNKKLSALPIQELSITCYKHIGSFSFLSWQMYVLLLKELYISHFPKKFWDTCVSCPTPSRRRHIEQIISLISYSYVASRCPAKCIKMKAWKAANQEETSKTPTVVPPIRHMIVTTWETQTPRWEYSIYSIFTGSKPQRQAKKEREKLKVFILLLIDVNPPPSCLLSEQKWVWSDI